VFTAAGLDGGERGGGRPRCVATHEWSRGARERVDRKRGALAGRIEMLKQLGESLSSGFIGACNAVGRQTHITVANYTDRQVLLTLEVGNVVYRREELPPNETHQDDRYVSRPLVSENQEERAGGRYPESQGRVMKRFGTNFATCKLPCGFAWYTIGATVAGYSDFSDDLVAKLPK